MAIQYTAEVKDDILFVTARGFDENLEDVQNYGRGIIDLCKQSGVTLVLCDETALEYRLGTLDTYEAGKYMSENVPILARVAIVSNPEFFSDAEFFEDVVVNRGLTLRFFSDIDTSMHWLKGA
ncbi:hypothetical protein [Chlorobium ferrooxidans]|uniref:DUF4180 domain-containing protein n=1 Tax=Chlorobium ferrooxidans DSM 13031 TaxID=377431 RepID=Q0YRM3_9CHLB|nr:hypothetical protein [Chlorobium ferrooxidans]EAT58988.1 hypothetical protein CferDRAFT_0962 [Chlorobium ferrooxidans DSM 13031]